MIFCLNRRLIIKLNKYFWLTCLNNFDQLLIFELVYVIIHNWIIITIITKKTTQIPLYMKLFIAEYLLMEI